MPTGNNTNLRKVVTFCDLSKTGLSFTLVGNVNIKIGDTVRTKFDLENKQSTTVEKEVIVRFMRDNRYGCECQELDFKEREIGFFLLGG